jgi:hypothetical protein
MEETMQTRYARHRTFAPLLALAIAACADPAAPWEAPQHSASASPKAGFFPLDIQFPDPDLCAAHGGFTVWTALSGNLKIATVQQKQNGGIRVVEALANGEITLNGGGATLRSPLAGTVFYDVDADDNLAYVTFVGLNGAFTVPGAGRVALETGRLVIDGSGNIIFERGPHDVFGSSPNVEKLCAHLAP